MGDPPTDASAASPTAPSGAPAGDPFADPAYREAIVDLLGVLAYGELSAFSRMASDAEMAPSLRLKAALSRMAAGEFGHHDLLVARIRELGADPEEAMAPFVGPVDAFHDRTRPTTWLEGLVKAYIGDGIANDFYREVASWVDAGTRDLITDTVDDAGKAEFIVAAVREGIAHERTAAGRLALWGRRLVGEALSQAQAVVVERDAMASLLVGGIDRDGADLAEIGRMFTRLTDAHTRRMGRLGLNA